jgi:hypothetical protein
VRPELHQLGQLTEGECPMSKPVITSTTIPSLSFLPRLGKPFCSWKTSASIKPHNLDESDLLTHLEGDCRVRSFAPLDATTAFQHSIISALPESVWYSVEHEAGPYVYLLLGRTLGVEAATAIQQISDTIIQHGRRLFTLDPLCLRREPRWTNVKQILSCRHFIISPSDRFRILDHVDSHGSAELEVCAAMCRSSDDPVGAVLSLVADRSLALNLERQLSLSSLLYCLNVREEVTSGFPAIDQVRSKADTSLTTRGRNTFRRSELSIIWNESDDGARY